MRGIDFEVDGKAYRLRFDFNALAALEGETGKSLDQLGELLAPAGGGVPRMTDLRLLFWAGLGAKGTKEAAGEIMADLTFALVSDLIMRAFIEAFPQIAAAVDSADAPGNGSGVTA